MPLNTSSRGGLAAAAGNVVLPQRPSLIQPVARGGVASQLEMSRRYTPNAVLLPVPGSTNGHSCLIIGDVGSNL